MQLKLMEKINMNCQQQEVATTMIYTKYRLLPDNELVSKIYKIKMVNEPLVSSVLIIQRYVYETQTKISKSKAACVILLLLMLLRLLLLL